MKCKQCGYSGAEFKFCPDCGEKTMTIEDRLDRVERILEEMKASDTKKVLVVSKVEKSDEQKPERIREKFNAKDRAQKIANFLQLTHRKMSIAEAHRSVFAKGASSSYLNSILKEIPKFGVHVGDDGYGRRVHFTGEAAPEKPKRDMTKNSARMKGVAKRGQELRAQGLNRSEAMKQACKEYDEGHKSDSPEYMLRNKPVLPKTFEQERIGMLYKQAPKAQEKTNMPEIKCIEKRMLPVFFDILRNVIKFDGYFSLLDAQTIGIEGDKDYIYLMSAIAFNLGEIASYLGVPNKFSFEGVGKNLLLRYRG